jgi:ribosomal protein S26
MSHKFDNRYAGKIKCTACGARVPKGTLVQHMSEKHPIKAKPKLEDATGGYTGAKHEPH